MTKKKILIVDDSTSIRTLEKIYLGSNLFEFVEAVDGEQGFSKAVQEKPDLILLDMQMPVKDGVEALRDLKGNSATKHIPVLVVSTLVQSSENEQISECKRLGAADFVSKPIVQAALVKAVQQILHLA